ncbi:MAG: cytochrome c biogenesis CcdA family protein [Dehalococcoidales bacterium]|nr:cytochrome c biogenesis CcdA family protein [Dehalococcoidales bacterium]MDD4794083.1 cytochrome c biogenesis CcdA family protein [Dehalococcoidales bacterium]
MEQIPFIAALGAGVASFLSPCVLPLVPVFLASLAGPEVLNNPAYERSKLLFSSLSFVAGFGVIFTLAGALAGIIGISLSPNSLVVRLLSGIVLIILGLIMLLALKIPAFNYEARLNPRLGNTSGYIRSALIGGSFALAWTPCLSPILGGILMLALNSSTALQGALLLAVYSIGLGLPFIVMGLAFTALHPIIKRINKYSRYIYVASGFILIGAGILILSGKLDWLYI